LRLENPIPASDFRHARSGVAVAIVGFIAPDKQEGSLAKGALQCRAQ